MSPHLVLSLLGEDLELIKADKEGTLDEYSMDGHLP